MDLGGGANAVGGIDYDRVVIGQAGNQLTLSGQLELTVLPTFAPTPGTVYGLIDNKSSLNIIGEFDGLPNTPNGAAVTIGGWNFILRYDGKINPSDPYSNDVTLELVSTGGGTGSVSGTAWDDADGDGVKDVVEPLAAGIPVDVINVATGHAVRVVTNSSGAYTAPNLAAGNYTARFDKAASPTYATRRFATTSAANPATGIAGPYFVDVGAAVTNVNAGLVANAAPVGTTTALTTERGDTLTATVGGTDAENDAFTVVLVDAPQNGTLTLTSTGSLTYVPNSGFVGTDWFSYRLSDMYGSGELMWVEITVRSHAPTATADTATTNEDTAVTLSVLSNDTDPDNDTLTVLGASDGLFGTTVVNTDGTITYTPYANWNGTDTFAYLIDDGYGRLAIGTATVTVTPVNDEPTPADVPTIVVQQNTPLDIDLRALVTDVETAPDDLVFSVGYAVNGAVVLLADGHTARFTPNSGYHGAASFGLSVTDTGDGDDTGETAILTADLSVNRPPVAGNASFNVPNSQSTALALAPHYSDPDGDPVAVVAVTQPATGGGSVSINSSGQVVYLPPTGFNGTVTFTYTVSDGRGGTATGTVTLNVGDPGHGTGGQD